jgi:Transcriptional activator TraM
MHDVKHLLKEVASRHGVCIGEDDPVLCVITLNELMLEDAANSLAAQIVKAKQEIDEAADKVHKRVALVLAQQFKEYGAKLRQELVEKIQGIPIRNEAKTSDDHEARCPLEWLAVGVLSGLMMFAIGILLGFAYQKWW